MAVVAKYCPNIEVTVVDINEERINSWNNNNLTKLPIFEPGLKELIEKIRNKNLFFSVNIKKAISEADMVFISVNTPTKETGFWAGYSSDLKWVEASARQVAEYSTGHTIVVEKSTVPVKTAELIQTILESQKVSTKGSKIERTFSVLSSPEFLAEGTAIKDLENPDRVLVGGEDKEAIDCLTDIYKKWIPEEKILLTNLWSSELSKLTANAFLAQRISSINSISALCEATGAQIKEVSNAIGSDKRIGKKFLNAGPGFGGSCFQKDILNLVYLCRFYGLPEAADYWENVIYLNKWQRKRIANLIVDKFFGTVTDKKIVILGFAFKANTNDFRESPAYYISKELLENGATLTIHDPKVSYKQINLALKNISSKNDFDSKFSCTNDLNSAFENADAIVILTEWEQYNDLDWEKISKLMRYPAWVFDTRNILKKSYIEKLGMKIWSLGDGYLK